MILYPPERPRKRRDVQFSAPEPLAAAPVLVAVEYQPAAWVRLTFDVAVDVAGFLPATVLVSDEDANASMGGRGPVVAVSPAVVQVPLEWVGGSAGPGTTLTVAADNGVAAVAGGVAWAGVSGAAIPFG